MELGDIEDYPQLEGILEKSSWQVFEEIVGEIFEHNGYDVEVGEVITFENTKRQYDIIAENEHCVIADCKKWDNKRRIKHGLKRAVEDQIERVEKLSLDKEKFPILVLSSKTPIRYHKYVPIVSVQELNCFLSNFSKHERKVLSL